MSAERPEEDGGRKVRRASVFLGVKRAALHQEEGLFMVKSRALALVRQSSQHT